MNLPELLTMLKECRIQLKAMKSMPGPDGLAWHANVYLDGKKVGTCGDAGRGGEVDLDVTPVAMAAIVSEMHKYGEDDAQVFVCTLGDAVETRQNLKKSARTRIMYVTAEHGDGEYGFYKVTGGGKVDFGHIEQVKKMLAEKGVEAVILNELL